MSVDAAAQPVDAASRDDLAANGLRLAVVDESDRAGLDAWAQAVRRGFLDVRGSSDALGARHELRGHHRHVGVWDETAAEPATPVGTIESWVSDLTVPGGAAVPAWAISGVTVAPTHRRRGIARHLLGSELRTAAAAGLSLAMLTVSEATIYGRFGFAPSAMAADLEVDTRRARWTGPTPTGRTHLVEPATLRAGAERVIDRVRRATPGNIVMGEVFLRRMLGTLGEVAGDKHTSAWRHLRHDDADGTPQGFAVYRLVEDDTDMARSTVVLHHLVAATDEAYAAIWSALLEMDLVSRVTAHLRPVDEPLGWMVDDRRAIRTTTFDHLWTRILDVPSALEARTYEASGRVVLEVDDPMGIAGGRFALEADASGAGQVTATDEPADVRLGIDALAALHLGGVRARMLQASGRVDGDVSVLDPLLATARAPYLDHWF
ncbi:GNAT family N-acetyltransferase [Aeromicrobium massiliense]|uniref:GNAT family N-acetyltransferase n=1 Tax=Aeromicrobium massiliense TaxID=1464554 RepID=UPI00057899C0|nr:GNAT family N-acetyltransferase [Aeromicrobium massiliense]